MNHADQSALVARALPWLLLLYCGASLLHFVHNAEYLASYPNLPVWISRGSIYFTWLGILAVGLCGYLTLPRSSHSAWARLDGDLCHPGSRWAASLQQSPARGPYCRYERHHLDRGRDCRDCAWCRPMACRPSSATTITLPPFGPTAPSHLIPEWRHARRSYMPAAIGLLIILIVLPLPAFGIRSI